MKKFTFILVLILIFGINAFSQENEYEWDYAFQVEGDHRLGLYEPYELKNGEIVVACNHYFRSGLGDFYSEQPALVKFSADGKLLSKKEWFKPGYRGEAPYIIETDENELIAIGAYNPDRDTTYFNYNPEIKHAILYFYKLDENLNKTDSIERQILLDTVYNPEWATGMPNEFNASIYMHSLFEDNGKIVGSYYKGTTRDTEYSTRRDTIFYFKMDYDGNIVYEKYNETEYAGSGWLVGRHSMFKNGDHYIGAPIRTYNHKDGEKVGGRLGFLDTTFNYIKSFSIPPIPHASNIPFTDYSYCYFKNSTRNTTYVSCNIDGHMPVGEQNHHDARLMEVYFSDSGQAEVRRHITRGTPDWDRMASIGIDYIDENNLFWCYALNVGFWDDLDSWIVIECLDEDWNVKKELMYGCNDNYTNTASSIKVTRDGGVLLICGGPVNGKGASIITKFPAEAFVSVEEAHAHGLRAAVAYPNPGNNTLNIETGLKDSFVEVYDISGRKVFSQEISNDVTSISTETWSTGMYMWRIIQNGKAVESGKWMKR